MKLLIILSLFSLASCGTLKPVNADEEEKLTGVKSIATVCFGLCLDESIAYAKNDCSKLNKKYEYVYNVRDYLKYKCI